MNLNKSLEFFDPSVVTESIHIIGCGSVGSSVAENLARCGISNFDLWDFDTVESKNIANQLFREKDIGKLKVDALTEIIKEINPDSKIETHKDGWKNETLSGYIFLCVDNIELRKTIAKRHLYCDYVKAFFDFRTELTSAQHFAADWSNRSERKDFINTMNYSQEEAMKDIPVSACGTVLGVVTTVRLIVAFGVNNFINFIKNKTLNFFLEVEGFKFKIAT